MDIPIDPALKRLNWREVVKGIIPDETIAKMVAGEKGFEEIEDIMKESESSNAGSSSSSSVDSFYLLEHPMEPKDNAEKAEWESAIKYRMENPGVFLFRHPVWADREHSPIMDTILQDRFTYLYSKSWLARTKAMQATALDYLKKLDDECTGGTIQKLTEDTGGIKLFFIGGKIAVREDLDSFGTTSAWRYGPKDNRVLSHGFYEDANGCPKVSILMGDKPKNSKSVYHCRIRVAYEICDSWSYTLKEILAHEFCHACCDLITHSGDTDYPEKEDGTEWTEDEMQAFDHGVPWRNW
ncbi:hypothetical protein ABW19_dt0200155 [Dactylella cylindrospora]|nr:hypothetical protein ABW19_dt0200155 [Dactylella cylindrospora]